MKFKLNKKTVALMLATLISASAFTGCAAKEEPASAGETATEETATEETTTEEATAAPEAASDAITFPLKEKITLTAFYPFKSTIAKDLNEHDVYMKMEELTNIHMDWIHPAGDAAQAYNLLIASNDLPDLFFREITTKYPGGIDKAIDEGAFLKLNDLIDKYAPNYKALRASNPEIARQTITDAGNIGMFSCVALGLEKPWCGLIARSDWMSELGLSEPKTIDDLYTMIKTFKEKKNAPLELMSSWQDEAGYAGTISSAYGVIFDFYNDKGTIKYGPIESGFKEYLTTLNKWYNEGLIDPDFASVTPENANAMFASGKTGVKAQDYGSFNAIELAGKEVDPNFAFVAIPNVVAKAGDVQTFKMPASHVSIGVAITAANKYVPESVAWLDYGYSDDGFMLYNYGLEDKAWKWEPGPATALEQEFFPQGIKSLDKHPVFTDFMLKNPDGYDWGKLSQKYRVHISTYLRTPMVNVTPSIEQAMITWDGGVVDADNIGLHDLILTPEDQENYAAKFTDLDTYVRETTVKFVMGTEPLDKFDAFVEQVKGLGIDELVGYYQSALERYNNRQ